jgi:hypothetical protein
MESIYEKYGKLMVELEILQAKIRETKISIANDLQAKGTSVEVTESK